MYMMAAMHNRSIYINKALVSCTLYKEEANYLYTVGEVMILLYESASNPLMEVQPDKVEWYQCC